MAQNQYPESDNTHAPGSQPAHFNQGGDEAEPGKQPDEVVPGKGDEYRPGHTPDEVAPDQGDFDRPDSAPIESPPQPDVSPPETMKRRTPEARKPDATAANMRSARLAAPMAPKAA